ncbi:MAG: TetR/AcrR family transcriptional regulator [Caldilineales bacterium]
MSSELEQLDPRVQRTRQQLEEALLALLSKKKFQAITIQQITTRAGVNRVTFYDHYEDKYDLYRHIVRKTFGQIMAENLAATTAASEDQLRALVRAVCAFFEQLNSACPPTDRQSRPLVEIQVQAQLQDYLLQWLQIQQEMGLQLPAAPEITAKMMSWAIFGSGLDWEQNDTTGTVDEIAGQIFAVVARIVSGEQKKPHPE